MSERVRITARPRGPLVVEGAVELVRADGTVIESSPPKKLRLCRCGHSRTAPLCDSSHNRLSAAEFVPGEIGDAPRTEPE